MERKGMGRKDIKFSQNYQLVEGYDDLLLKIKYRHLQMSNTYL